MNSPELLMSKALALAARARGHVEPNPLVGAVIARDGQIVGEGFHEQFGHAHAEINALRKAGETAKGATLYVTLEPCCHHGKTSPCTEAIIKAGIRKVVCSMLDPFPEVAGKGVKQLQNAGIEVEVDLLEAEAQELNAPYLRLIQTGRPWVIAKWAMSLDGKIATPTGDSQWITGEEARKRVHELRGRMDAIIVGVETILKDDPMLTARPTGPRVATRIVLDSKLRTPLGSRLVQTANEAKVLVAHAANANRDAKRKLEQAGCECREFSSEAGLVSVSALLSELGRQRMTNVLVEGGGQILGSFFAAREIDEFYAFIAPKLIGGKAAPSPIEGQGTLSLSNTRNWSVRSVEQLGDDWLFRGRLRLPASGTGID